MAVAQRMRWLAYIPLRVALLLGVMALGLLGVIQAQAIPPVPMAFHGTLTIAGSPAAIGTVVCGRIDGVDKGCITTTESGQYGGSGGADPKLIVQSVAADIDKPIQFFVTPPGTVGGLAFETGSLGVGDITELNLSLATAAAPTAAAAPTPTSAPAAGGGGGAPPPPLLIATPTPTPVPPVTVSEVVELEVTIEVVVTEEQTVEVADALNEALGIDSGTGEAVEVVAGTTELVSVEGSVIEATIEVTGLTAEAEFVGVIDLTLGNITIETVDGEGTGEIVLAEGLTVVGNVTLVPEDGALAIVFEDTRLIVEPEAPDVEQLLGGSAQVTHIDVTFDVGLENLPEGASLEIEFAKSADAFVENVGVVFQLAAEQIFGEAGGVLEDPVEDVAFVVRVTRVGIENTDLGDNTITMEISREWYDARVAQGKTIVITKIADDGTVTAAEATCVVVADIATCQVTLTGDAGGFSVFAVIAVIQAATATPTPTAGPTATPSPTPTPTPVPPSVTVTPTPTAAAPPTPPPPGATATPTTAPEPTATATPTPAPTPVVVPTVTPTPPQEPGGGGALIFIIIGAVVLIGGGAAAFFVLRGRGS